MIDFEPLNFGFGWRKDIAAEAVPAAVEKYGVRTASIVPKTKPRDKVDLTKYQEAVWGKKWYLNQLSCGSCVAVGLAGGLNTFVAKDAIRSGTVEATMIDPMTIYWGSRVEIGKNRINGDGSVGAWAAEYVKQYGILPQKRFAEADLSKYDPDVCCGERSYKGVPDGLEPEARKFPVKDYVQCRNFDDMVTLIDKDKPVTVASDVGYDQQLDRNGFTRIGPKPWRHQMWVGGYELGSRPCGYVVNNWGLFYLAHPSGMPDGWCLAMAKVDADILDRQFRQGDSYGYSETKTWARLEVNFDPLNF